MKEKIVFFDHTSILSGGERSLLEILKAFPWNDYEPVLVSPSEGPLTREASGLGVKVHILPVSRAVLDRRRQEISFLSLMPDFLRTLSSVFRLRRLLSRERASLLVTNSQKAHLIGALASVFSTTPLFWYFRDILPKRLRRLVLVLGLVPKEIIAISEAVSRQFSTAGKRWHKVVLIPNAVDHAAITQGTVARAKVFKELGIPARARLAGSVGQIARWKGQAQFIKGAKRVSDTLKDVYFLIIGEALFGGTDYRKELVQLVDDLALGDKVVFTGHREDPLSYINAVDVLVHTPSEPEPFGRVLLEAMALGKPVVASNSGAVPEIVIDGETGILVSPEDVDALTRALEYLLKRPDIARRMGRRGRERARRLFSIERLVQDLYLLFDPVLKKGVG